MILLSRYLLAQFFVNFLTVSSAFVSIYLLVDFFEKIDKFTSHGGTMSMALRFFLLNIPFILDQLGPVLILLAGVITFGILNHNNEFRALKAGGIPLRIIIRPLLLAGTMVTLLMVVNGQWLLPKTISTTNRIWYEQLQGKVPLGTYRGGRYYYKGQEGFYSFEWPDPEALVFKQFSYSKWNESFKLQQLYNTHEAHWQDGTWVFSKGQIQKMENNGSYSYESFEQTQIVLPESPENFFIPEYKSAERSISELFLDISKQETQEQTVIARAQFYSRISYLLLGLPLLILGLPILILSYQRWGRDLAIAIPASCGLAFVAWGIWGALQSLAKASYISPFISATAVHLLFAITGFLLLKREDK